LIQQCSLNAIHDYASLPNSLFLHYRENISRSNAILLLVDATNARKEYLTSTVHDLRNHNPSAQIIIVSTKKDLLGDSSTPILDDLKNEANNIDGCSFVSVCCKDVGSTDQLWEKLKDAIDPQPQNPGQKLEVMNIEELKRFWSNYAEFFAKAIATATAAIGHCMLSMMKIGMTYKHSNQCNHYN